MSETTVAIVTRLGGADVLAAKFGILPKAVEMWCRRGGIPGRWHIPLLKFAEERGVELSTDELLSASQTSRSAA